MLKISGTPTLNALTKSLQILARQVTPFYNRVAKERDFAAVVALEVRRKSSAALFDLIKLEIPQISEEGVATDGKGFDTCFAVPSPVLVYCLEIESQLRKVPFSAVKLRSIATSLLPFLQKLKNNRRFAQKVALGILTRNRMLLQRLVRSITKSSTLASINLIRPELFGLELRFRFSDGNVFTATIFSARVIPR